MSIEFNKVTWYSKLGAVILFLVIVPILTIIIGRKYQEVIDIECSITSAPVVTSQEDVSRVFQSVENGTYEIDGQHITFTGGKSVQASSAGGESKTETMIFGKPSTGDLDGDGKNDALFIVTQETGGTGIFFFAVAAVGVDGGYTGTKAVFLGDRIAPQTTQIKNGVGIVNYAVRKDSEPMTAQPSIGVTKRFKIQEGELLEVEKIKGVYSL